MAGLAINNNPHPDDNNLFHHSSDHHADSLVSPQRSHPNYILSASYISANELVSSPEWSNLLAVETNEQSDER